MLSVSDKQAVFPMLRDIPLFSSLDVKGLDNVANSAERRDYEAGTIIAKEGERALIFFLILNGAVEVRRGGRVLANLEPGRFFGEMSLFDNQARSADVVATEDTSCILLTSRSLARVIAGNPKMQLRHKEGLYVPKKEAL